jgi:ribonuclease-3
VTTAGFPPEIAEALGHTPRDPRLFQAALTHSSHGGDSYQRLEFLGDRVLGLLMGEWLFALFPAEPEGKLSRRLNVLVSGDTCADIARDLDLGRHIHLGKQARDDGAQFSTYVLGDVLEALIGALFLECGIEGARAFVRRAWGDRVHAQDSAPRHPKAELQEHAAAKQWRAPVYEVIRKAGPHHAPTFTISVSIPGRASAEGTGTSKQEAETEAARALLKELKT